VTGVAGLASDDGVLQIDQPQEEHLIAEERPGALVFRQTEEEAVGLPHVTADRRHHVRVEPLLERAFLDDRRLLLVPHHRPVARGRDVHALHRRVPAGVAAEELVPDIQARRDVPDTLQERQQTVWLG
jgi:hypothetical protein